VTQSVIDRQARRRPPVVLDVEGKLGRVGIEVRSVLGVAGEGGQSKKEIGEGVAGERPVEKVAAVILPREERDLILVLDVLDICAGFYRVTAANPSQVVIELKRSADDISRFVAAGRDEGAITKFEGRNAARGWCWWEAREAIAAHQFRTLTGEWIAAF